MGNEGSNMKAFKLCDPPLLVASNWSLHSAENSANNEKVSVLVSHQVQEKSSSLLLKASKNLKVYRHPNIIHYVDYYCHGSSMYLVTEPVIPLSLCLNEQSELHKCLGLYSVLKGLIFLHEKAKCSHNNICKAAIYVTPNGTWKLGGLEFMSKFKETSDDVLEQYKKRCYDKAVPPEEEKNLKLTPNEYHARDAFAFGVLVVEVFVPDNGDIQIANDFIEFAAKKLQHNNPAHRPILSIVKEHPFFNSDFIAILNFLQDLPLKSDTEKDSFFRSCVGRLQCYPETLVATQLGDLLLSRLVLLNTNARDYLIPSILTPSTESNVTSLFSNQTFTEHIIPLLTKVFHVRDTQIRLVLLQHFTSYCHLFPMEQLQSDILPQVLLGIKDTNDVLVSVTLRCLADLVPLLGSEIVIGGNRSRLFSDGRPKAVRTQQMKLTDPNKKAARIQRREERRTQLEEKRKLREQEKVTPVKIAGEVVEFSEILSVRHPPDGGESDDGTHGTNGITDTAASGDSWSDWEDTTQETVIPIVEEKTVPEKSVIPIVEQLIQPEIDLKGLDVKTIPVRKSSEDKDDFFVDMEPVINEAPKLSVIDSKFQVKLTSNDEEQLGWGTEDWDE